MTQVQQIPLPAKVWANARLRYNGPATQLSLWQLLSDFYRSTKVYGFWLYSAWLEILLNYRSTVLGPLWIVVSTAIFVFSVGTLYNRVVLSDGSNIYLAHLTVGITLWYLMIQSVVQSCSLFLVNRATLLDGVVTYTDLLLKLLTTNLIYLLHNTVVIAVVFAFLRLMPGFPALVLLLTVPLVLANLIWICVILAIFGARYADLEELVHSALRLIFFITPILWIPQQHTRGPVVDAILYLNPFYYFVEVIRKPLLYGTIPYFEISVLLVMLPIGWLVASYLYARTRSSIALWL